MWRRVIDCLGVSVAISSRVEEIAEQLAAVLRTYAEARDPVLDYVLERAEWPQVVRDGTVIKRCDEIVDLVPALELDLYREVAARAAGLVIHAGAVVDDRGDAFVVAGRSGAGKSTLVRALLGSGFRYLTEECVALRDDGSCAGLARALHVDESVEVPPGFRCDDYELRTPSGPRLTRLFHPPESLVWRGTARARALVLIDHAPDAVDRIERLASGAALAKLWPLAFRTEAAVLATATLVVGTVACFELTTRTPKQALARMLELARGR